MTKSGFRYIEAACSYFVAYHRRYLLEGYVHTEVLVSGAEGYVLHQFSEDPRGVDRSAVLTVAEAQAYMRGVGAF